MQLIQPNNKKISSKNIRNKLRAHSCKGRALRDSKFVSERQTNKHRQEIKTNISLTQVRKYMKKPTNLIFREGSTKKCKSMVFYQIGGGVTQNQTLIAKIKIFDIECVSSDMHKTYRYLMIAVFIF